MHRNRRGALLLNLLVVGRKRQQLVEICDRPDVIALGAEQLCPRKIGPTLGLRSLRDGAGEILDCMIDIALAAVGLTAPVERVWRVRVDRKRGIDVTECRIELTGLDRGTRAADIGHRQVLAQRNRLVEIGKRVREGSLVSPEIAAREISERILRLEFDRAFQIGARQIEIAGALACIGARQQRRHELRIYLQRGFGIIER